MSYMDYSYALGRIATALENIAKELEKANEKSGLLGEEKAGARTTTYPATQYYISPN